jgi:hypothetical protein
MPDGSPETPQCLRDFCYPVVSAKPDIFGVVEHSTTTAGGDLKRPDKHDATRSSQPEAIHERALWEAGSWAHRVGRP